MLKAVFPHKLYSKNKLKIKQVIKKYGMSWDGSRNGWVNEATGDGVFLDKQILDMILDDTFSEDMPMTLYIKAEIPEFIKEVGTKWVELGGELIESEDTDEELKKPAKVAVSKKSTDVVIPEKEKKKNIFLMHNMRDVKGCNTDHLKDAGYEDLQNISKRWERRKKQLLYEYGCMGLNIKDIEKFLHREEMAFRKNNACWITGEFSGVSKQD